MIFYVGSRGWVFIYSENSFGNYDIYLFSKNREGYWCLTFQMESNDIKSSLCEMMKHFDKCPIKGCSEGTFHSLDSLLWLFKRFFDESESETANIKEKVLEIWKVLSCTNTNSILHGCIFG